MAGAPWGQPAYPAYPYAQPLPQPYRPPQPRAPVATRPPPRPAVPVVRRVEVPPPEKLGIRLADAPAVVVPPPETLGISLE